jgi:hypothetical protein
VHGWVEEWGNVVQDGHTETLRVLVEELGADVNVKRANGKTAVMMAAQVTRPQGLSENAYVTCCIPWSLTLNWV